MIKTKNNTGEDVILNIQNFTPKGDFIPNATIIFQYTFLCPSTFTPKTTQYILGTIQKVSNSQLEIYLREDFKQ